MNLKMAPRIGSRAQDVISVLVVVTAERSAEIGRILSHTRWKTEVVHSVREGVQILRTSSISLALCEDRLSDGRWLDLVRETLHLRPRPKIIVFSSSASLALWEDVLGAGAYDLLAAPIDPRELYTVIPSAWRRLHGIAEKMTAAASEAKPVHELVDAK